MLRFIKRGTGLWAEQAAAPWKMGINLHVPDLPQDFAPLLPRFWLRTRAGHQAREQYLKGSSGADLVMRIQELIQFTGVKQEARKYFAVLMEFRHMFRTCTSGPQLN